MAQGSSKSSKSSSSTGDAKTKPKPEGASGEPATGPTTSQNGGPKITLTGAQQTNLATLCARANDARLERPLLNDTWALHVLKQVQDYDFSGVAPGPFAAAAIVKRAMILDRWAKSFLNKNPRATVVHLACGLDSRSLRLCGGQEENGSGGANFKDNKPGDAGKGKGADVCWVDLDLPDVVALRRQLLPAPSGPGLDYRLVAASVTDEGWLEAIPADRPTLVVMEGLTMYLAERDGIALLRRVLRRFRTGALIFDTIGSVVMRAQGLIGVLRYTGARFGWAVDRPKYLELLDERLRLVESAGIFALLGAPYNEMFPAAVRTTFQALGYLPLFRVAVEHIVRDIIMPGGILRFEF